MEKELYKYLGHRVRTLRTNEKLTQDQLALICDVCGRTISNIECGYSMPDFGTVIKISQFFKISLDDLTNFQANSHKSQSRIDAENLLIEQIKKIDDSQLSYVSEQMSMAHKYVKGSTNEN